MSETIDGAGVIIDRLESELAECKEKLKKKSKARIKIEEVEYDVVSPKVLADITQMQIRIAELESEFLEGLTDRLRLQGLILGLRAASKVKDAEIELLHRDIGFYRCCALSGEIPDDSQAPSALSTNDTTGEG